MALKPDARQNVKYAIVDIALADVSDELSKEALELPQGSTVVDIQLIVDTIFNDTTTETLSIGDASSATRYANAVALGTAGLVGSVAPTGFETTSSEPTINIIYAGGTGDASTGAARLVVGYVEAGRHDENFGDGVEFAGAPA